MNEIKSRYGYIFRLIEELKPKSIIEIGVAKGKTAKLMLDTAPKDTTYTGYDVFDFSDQEFHKMVGNGKRVHSVSQVKQRLKEHASRVELIKGVTQETLWKNPKSADLVFIDGDHRVESIIGDFKSVSGSKVVVFDDYYINDIHGGFDRKNFGCYSIVKDMKNVLITEPCGKVMDVCLAIWTEDDDTFSKIQDILK